MAPEAKEEDFILAKSFISAMKCFLWSDLKLKELSFHQTHNIDHRRTGVSINGKFTPVTLFKQIEWINKQVIATRKKDAENYSNQYIELLVLNYTIASLSVVLK